MNSYELSRNFCNWAFDNPEKVKPIHYAIYFFSIEHCNRLGWKDKFGLPSQMVMEAIGVKNWRTYSSGLNDLVEFGFIEMIETSKNQYSSNIIAIVNFTKAPTKALDKALSKHSTKHSQSTVSIDKQITSNKEQVNKNEVVSSFLSWFNGMKLKHKGTEGKFKTLTPTDVNNLLKLKEQNYNSNEWEHAYKMMLRNDWIKANGTDTPTHFLVNTNFAKYLNQEDKETKQPLSEDQIRYNYVMEQMRLNSNQ